MLIWHFFIPNGNKKYIPRLTEKVTKGTFKSRDWYPLLLLRLLSRTTAPDVVKSRPKQ
jgi:hypothetical protein